jgi:hypothetical protein
VARKRALREKDYRHGDDVYIPKVMLAFFCVQVLALTASAAEVKVGDRLIKVPSPEGFVELTPKMSPYYETMRAYVAPNNVRYLTLITKEKADALLRGEDIELHRYINVESEKGISTSSVSSSQFTQLRNILRNQIDDMYANVQKHLPEIVDEGNKAISAEFAADMALELGGLVTLPIHLDTNNTIANSMYMTVGATVDGEHVGTNVLAVTTLFLHVKDKVLFLYVYGSESELDWTRDTAATWAADIVAANPLSDEEKRAVDKSDSISVDWSQVLEKALIGALVGGLVGFVSLYFRKRKKE